MTYVIEGLVEQPSIEDGGCAAIAQVVDDADEGLFVRLHSWFDEPREHADLLAFAGKRVRVTVEVIE